MEYFEPLIAILFGFILSQATEYIKNHYKEAEQKRNSRLLLTLEIKKNYQLFSVFWNDINRKLDKFKISDVEENKIIHRFGLSLIIHPQPQIKHEVWSNLIKELPKHFTMREINKYWDFYETLFELSILQKIIISKKIDLDINYFKYNDLILRYKLIATNLFNTKIV
ncbi:MAG: hypothetical protein RBR38_11545 [Desulfomicrobium apsheronum]|nr:hypothetical protein [Desulfomicrobium apsheronum]